MIVMEFGSSSRDTSIVSLCSSVVPADIGNQAIAQRAREFSSPQPATSHSMVVVPRDPGDPDTSGAPTILHTQAVTPTSTVSQLHHDPRGTRNTGKGKQKLVLENFSAEKQKKGL